MIERAIENWLINTNERNYQVAFCQILLHEGHKVIYISSHRPMEQGKDIITIDKSGDYCAYQLKTGNIDLNKWRNISGEVRELIELPILHPSVNKTKVHKSFLVTNGEITDEVRIQIDQINEDNQRKGRGCSYLDIINGQVLLKKFIDAQGRFIPKDLEDFRLFLELFLAEGTDFLPKHKFFNFLNDTIFYDVTKQKSNVINAISSSIIITAYLLNPYQIKNNFYALFEAWASLAVCIVRYAQRTELKEEDWIESLNLVRLEIVWNLLLLKEEALKRKDFLEGEWRGDGGLIYRARATIVLGALATVEIHLQMMDKKHVQDEKLVKLIKGNINILWLWGESAFPYFFSLIKYLEFNNEGQIAQSLLDALFLGIVNKNSRRSENGLANPYYSVNDVLEAVLGIDTGKIDFGQFSGSSYTLETVILMMARRNEREALEKNWRRLSHIQFKEFKPDNVEDTFVWQTEEGLNYAEFPKMTQSWAELSRKANDLGGVPDLYLKYSDLLHFFILVCPYRVNKLIVNLLDQESLKI